MEPTVILIIAGTAALTLILVGVVLELNSRANASPQPQPSYYPSSRSSGLGGRGFTVIFIIVAIVGIAGVVYYFSINSEETIVKRQYGDKVAGLCMHIDGDANQDNLPAGERPYRVVVMQADGTRHTWHDQLDDFIQADDGASTDIVACVTEMRFDKIEDCPYYREDAPDQGTFFHTWREQLYVDVVLMNLATDLPIATFKVYGSAPGPCPEYARGYTGELKEIRGTEPAFASFQHQLREHVQ